MKFWTPIEKLPENDCECRFTNEGFPIIYKKGRFIKDKKRFELENGSDLPKEISHYEKN